MDAKTNKAPAIIGGILAWMAVILCIYQIFGLHIGDFRPVINSFLYLVAALLLPGVFLFKPTGKTQEHTKYVTLLDIVLAGLAFCCGIYFALNGQNMLYGGWDVAPPTIAWIIGTLWIIVILEASRRSAGMSLAIICLVFTIFPLVTSYLPGVLNGYQYSFPKMVSMQTMSMQGIIGVPIGVVATLIVGYLIFGSALTVTGGGAFFINFANALMGQRRGGPAKVSIFGSAIFGTISGSAVSNVLTIGTITIPAMKSVGYPNYYAGAVEACASTGGVLMPPVMGAVAFIMAEFLGISYAKVCIAAAIPSILYYSVIFFQVDAYAAKVGLRGLSHTQLPPLKETLIQGWIFFMVLAVLLFFLFYMQLEARAPFYAIALVFLLALIQKETRPNLKTFVRFTDDVAKVLSNITGILAGIGLIIGALMTTGVAGAFAKEIAALAGNNVILLLFLGAASSFVLGMGMTMSACYILVALMVAPALIEAGLNPIAVHLFVMYWGMVSYITPPVAVASFAAAALAGASAMKVGIQACRLGLVMFILPFIFVIDPSLVFQGAPTLIIYSFVTCFVGLMLVSYGVEGYLLGVGKINWYLRMLSIVSGLFIVLPWWQAKALGGIIALATIGVLKLSKRRSLVTSIETGKLGT